MACVQLTEQAFTQTQSDSGQKGLPMVHKASASEKVLWGMQAEDWRVRVLQPRHFGGAGADCFYLLLCTLHTEALCGNPDDHHHPQCRSGTAVVCHCGRWQ